MKSLSNYITEAISNTIVLNKLEVKWNCPDELFIQVPESYGESDIQVYLDDTLLKQMPGEADSKALGKNERNITDEYFEYESMETTQGTSQKADIEWDDHYDSSLNSTSMNVVRIKGLKYVLVFDKFNLEDVEDGDEKDILFDLFNGMSTDIEKDMPFELSLNKENINWK